MVKVQIKWNKSTFDDIELELSEGLDVFKAQLFALTSVPPDRQKILNKGKQIKGDSDFKALPDGAKLMLMGAAEAVAEGPSTKVVFEEDLSESQKTVLVGGPGGGLTNVGNTCYLNSTLQCLRGIPQLKAALQEYERTGRAEHGQDLPHFLTQQLGRLFRALDSSPQPATPSAFLQGFREAFPQFAQLSPEGHYMQQDADECIQQIITVLASKLTKTPSATSAKNMVDYLFAGDMTSTVTCDETSDETPRTEVEPFRRLRCHIDADTSFLFQGISKSLEEKLEKRSPVLGRNAVFTKKSKIASLPPYLLVQFVRFDWRNDTKKRAKILKKVQYPIKLDVLDFCTDELRGSLSAAREVVLEEENKKLGLQSLKGAGKEEKGEKKKAGGKEGKEGKEDPSAKKSKTEPKEGEWDERFGPAPVHVEKPVAKSTAQPNATTTGNYDLFAAVTHKGRRADGGHYVGWVRQKGDEWYKFDDDVVTTATTEEIKDLCGGGDWHMSYLLMYRRIDDMVDRPKPQ